MKLSKFDDNYDILAALRFAEVKIACLLSRAKCSADIFL